MIFQLVRIIGDLIRFITSYYLTSNDGIYSYIKRYFRLQSFEPLLIPFSFDSHMLVRSLDLKSLWFEFDDECLLYDRSEIKNLFISVCDKKKPESPYKNFGDNKVMSVLTRMRATAQNSLRNKALHRLLLIERKRNYLINWNHTVKHQDMLRVIVADCYEARN